MLSALVVLIAPVIPLFLVVLHRFHPMLMSQHCASFLAGCVWVFGSILTLLAAMLGGAGDVLVLLQGSAIGAAIIAALLAFRSESSGRKRRWIASGCQAFAVSAAIWSLSVVAIVVVQAETLAENRRFCIGGHFRDDKVTSFLDLRGFSFFTTASGYKMGQVWYFHGVLLVEAEGGNEVYNWSPSRMRFDQVENPKSFLANPAHACTPRIDYWTSLL
ncbi:MAG: hypothetical protein R8L07_09010 [Alphaproteobacteria bacterium]|nr:hypothetical protein [Alphaproteobacteria bacterium]